MNNRPAANNSQELAVFAVAICFGAVALYVAVAAPTLVWSVLHGEPTLVSFGDAIGGGIRWIATGADGDPRRLPAFRAYRDVMPPPGTWAAMNVGLLIILVLAVGAALVRSDRWRGSRTVGLPRWHPRSWVTPRSWARPRDLRHLRTRRVRLNGRSAADGDSWPLGKLRGRALRSGPESHLMAVAPTRSGKTTRVVVPSLLEHQGPAIVLLNKTDVLFDTVRWRTAQGPVWTYAPLTYELRDRCGWTPLLGCDEWEQALRMGRWLFDADPTASHASHDSGGARFYNREAVGVALPPLLHAAALGGFDMSLVHAWLRSGIDGLDEPRSILAGRDARAAADSIAGIQALDERPRSLMLMSAAQLVDAYRFPSVSAFDEPEFRPEQLLDGGTLYVVVPESEQDLLAPILGGLLGSVLRVWERRAAADPRHDGPRLRILADEAAHLAPLGKLPTYLAVSAGWGVRWCLVYQSLSLSLSIATAARPTRCSPTRCASCSSARSTTSPHAAISAGCSTRRPSRPRRGAPLCSGRMVTRPTPTTASARANQPAPTVWRRPGRTNGGWNRRQDPPYAAKPARRYTGGRTGCPGNASARSSRRPTPT